MVNIKRYCIIKQAIELDQYGKFVSLLEEPTAVQSLFKSREEAFNLSYNMADDMVKVGKDNRNCNVVLNGNNKDKVLISYLYDDKEYKFIYKTIEINI